MISATTIKTYRNYTIERYTYSADVSATGKPLTMYEVYDNDTHEFINAYHNLWEAVYKVKQELVIAGKIKNFAVSVYNPVEYLIDMMDRIA